MQCINIQKPSDVIERREYKRSSSPLTTVIGNTPYAIESYLETYDNTQSKYVPFKLFPEQQMMLNNFEKYNTFSTWQV